jgi:hypothetical protein
MKQENDLRKSLGDITRDMSVPLGDVLREDIVEELELRMLHPRPIFPHKKLNLDLGIMDHPKT